jgi:hypothetical protein
MGGGARSRLRAAPDMSGHGPCAFEREILTLWDQGLSRQQIQLRTGYPRHRVESALNLNEDGAHRRHCNRMAASSAQLAAALKAAR